MSGQGPKSASVSLARHAPSKKKKKEEKEDRVSLQNLVIENDPQKAGDPQSRFRVSGVAQVGRWPHSASVVNLPLSGLDWTHYHDSVIALLLSSTVEQFSM